MRTTPGFTVTEMLVTLAIAGLLTGLAVPAMQGFVERNRSSVALNQLLGGLQSARYAAVSLRTTVTVCPSADATRCGARDTWHTGTLIFADRNRDGARDPSEGVVRWLPGFDDRARIYWRSFRNRSYLQFTPSGMTDWQNGHLLYCPPNRDPHYAREVILNAQARPRQAPDVDRDGIVEDANGDPVRCP
jgi:type IV fimbrial biogenesis protein FimT